MKIQVLGLAAAMMVAPALHAWESTRPARPPVRINRLERGEQRLIRTEFRSGELTRPEARRLTSEQIRIRRQEARANADGRLTVAERRRLRNGLVRARRHIVRAAHN
jgi:hypothetical protein